MMPKKPNHKSSNGVLPTNRSGADTMRFEVLKALKNAPTHGYNLYLLLSQKGLAAHPPEVYKILRSLKERGLVQEDTRDSAHGPQRKVLSLTQSGLEEYFARVTEAFQLLTDLMAEAQFTVVQSLLVEHLRENGVDYNSLENQVLLFDISYGPPIVQREILLKFAMPLQESNIIYIRTRDSMVWELFPFLEKILTNITILDENLAVKGNTVDLIFGDVGPDEQHFRANIAEFVNLLKPDGSLTLTKFGLEDVPPPPQRRMLSSLFRDFIQTFPQKFQQQILQMFPMGRRDTPPEHRLKNTTVSELLNQTFDFVQIHTDLPMFNLFFARNPKKTGM